MTKRRAIISLEKLSSEQKKKLEQDFPDGFLGSLTSIKTPTGQMMDALIWDTEEAIYLVKVNKAAFISALADEDEEEADAFEDEEIDAVDKIEVDTDDEDSEEEVAKKKLKDADDDDGEDSDD